MGLPDDPAMAERAAAVVEALAHPDRVRLVALLCEQDATAAELAERLGRPRPAVTRHLRALAAQGLLAQVKDGGQPRYRVVEPVLHGLVACMEECSTRAERGGTWR
jgi:DNA-binding transcriptional ArsR family regulator